MNLQHLQQQLDQYARLHRITGGMSIVLNGERATVYPNQREGGDLTHLISAPTNGIGAELARRIGIAMDRRCA